MSEYKPTEGKVPDQGEREELSLAESGDTRENLKADIYFYLSEAETKPANAPLFTHIIGWLDRQAAITANETNHNNPYVGLVRGKQWERTEISDYYCGRCGWKVTDHDSYCPECGGALHKASNKPNSQFDVLKTAETAENVTSKNEIHNFDDSRKRLEPDVVNIIRNVASHTIANTSIGDMLRYTVPGSGAAPWQLEEDACEALASIVENQLAELTAERNEFADVLKLDAIALDELRRQRDEAIEIRDQVCGDAATFKAERDELLAKVVKLNAHWRKSNDGWAEANAEAERWRQKCDHMQRVIDTQRDSFAKMERECAELRQMLSDAAEAI